MLANMEPSDLASQEYEAHTLTYYDGTSRRVLVTEIETPFPDGKLIVSRTDLAGNITHANASFVEMSAHPRERLIGAPHYILRHPHMPSVAYQGLWETVERGEKWHGYVKNLRADGGFYWVYATIIANIRNGEIVGYTSVRRKPARRKVEEAAKLYQSLQ